MADKDKPCYEFADAGGSPDEGINDPLRTTFDRDYNEVVSREALQNVLDAVKDHSKPAIVKFQLEQLGKKQIPEADRLAKRFEACAAYDASSRRLFENALKILASDRIPVLKISDFNTIGLSGEDEDKSGNFYNFLKSVGSTGKGRDAGGSFGLGKGSFIAASAFNTFFVTSIFEGKKKKPEYVFMGSLRLTTHRDGKAKMRGVGSYGRPGQKPIRDIDDIPAVFKREPAQTGTDLFIMAYRDQEEWRTLITKAVLRNFWMAIDKNRLQVHVAGMEISAKTLEKLMYEHYKVRDKMDDWKKRNPLPYYEAYKKAGEATTNLPILGKVRVFINPIKAGEPAPNHVACFRKTGMLIFPRKFNSVAPYAGVFVCENDEGNDVLRKMEPPNHDVWDINGAHAKDEKGRTLREVKDAEKEYTRFIKDEIKKLTLTNEEEALPISGLEDFLFLPAVDEKPFSGDGVAIDGPLVPSPKEGPGEIVKPQDGFVPATHMPVPVLKRAPGTPEGDEGSVEGEGPAKGSGDSKGGNGVGNGDGESGRGGGGETTARVVKARCRSFAVQNNGEITHQVIIRATPNLTCRIALKAGTDDAYERLVPQRVAPQGKIQSDGTIRGILLDKTGLAVLRIEFGTADKYSLSAVVYEDQ